MCVSVHVYQSGHSISWGEQCRIKHLPTRLYLAVVKEESVYKVRLYIHNYFSSTADF